MEQQLRGLYEGSDIVLQNLQKRVAPCLRTTVVSESISQPLRCFFRLGSFFPPPFRDCAIYSETTVKTCKDHTGGAWKPRFRGEGCRPAENNDFFPSERQGHARELEIVGGSWWINMLGQHYSTGKHYSNLLYFLRSEA